MSVLVMRQAPGSAALAGMAAAPSMKVAKAEVRIVFCMKSSRIMRRIDRLNCVGHAPAPGAFPVRETCESGSCQ
ncbi:hypothetical protein GCM10011491_15670 [Brucella endophytica]|uniref:Uncharacterized protein n=1 Tax=Brucella endophytica TaxID=1963359 RepID=A0A916S9Q9_9HYPH|nr:hypothetical protein GCM10011491_15670 [Brucella endophytica]